MKTDNDRGPEDKDDGDLTMDNSHISSHFINGSEDTHAISQEMAYDGDSFISYTDVSSDGEVGDSGFDTD